jgi:tetratricopeptide (TPR) repeat protein
MVAFGTITTAQFRLASYYLTKLRTIEVAYQHGHEHSTDALFVLDQEWSQIKRWRAWSAEHAYDHDAIADVCMEYTKAGVELFLIRLHPNERREWLEAGLAAARRLGDTHAEMVHQLHLGKTYSYLGSVAIALKHIQQALALAQQLDSPLYLCKSLIAQGGIYYGLDEYEKSRQAQEQALAIGTKLEAKHEIGAALNGLGNVAFSQSDYNYAHDCYERFMEISEEIGSSTGVCMSLRNLSMVTKRMGDFDVAIGYAERAVNLCREVGYQSCLAESLAELGGLTSERGHLSKAQDFYQQSLDLSRLISHRTNEAFVLYRLGCLLLKRGDISEARVFLEEAAVLSTDVGERWFAALAFMNLAEAFRLKGEFKRACLNLLEGWEIAAAVESRAIRVKYLVAAAQLWHDQGHLEQSCLWMGLLDQHVEKLMDEECSRYEDLRNSLQVELSHEQFNAALECGKALDLNDAIMHAMNDLEQIANSPLDTQPRVNPALDHVPFV